ncbi:DeoR/GlpR family DNA-binding transcription regulator [Arcanobacterium buesumense]|uniref:DeoR/GlpR transcriptional regulator n=1 Tax=Arcanobacterium buesumense TaxID=2722751 RepID=A0A6H2EM20_9ACTO|nr:DeoR/GlpR family DNA-binding transcription regulator [Arcanobacterium buesumense]QJC22125.1 DeoR/GlpR transcriptional regulator [Arcanobacterium buesumense]
MRLSSRQRKILSLLHGGTYLEVKDLAQLLHVDASTIRRDLQGLTAEGLIERRHGGAILRHTTDSHFSHALSNETEHLAVAKAAYRMLKDGDSLTLASGPISTLLALSLLDMQDLTIITNDLNSAMTLSANPTFKVHIPGGELRESPAHTVSGTKAEAFLIEQRTAWSFIEVEGIHPYSGFTISATWQTGITRMLLQAGKRKCVMADSMAFGRRCVGFVSETNSANLIMTDELLNDYELPAFGGRVMRIARDPRDLLA